MSAAETRAEQRLGRRLHRYRAQGVERIGGRLVVTVEDRQGTARRQPGPVKVHFRLGKWRFYADDAPTKDHALNAVAARAVAKHADEHLRARGAKAPAPQPAPTEEREQLGLGFDAPMQ